MGISHRAAIIVMKYKLKFMLLHSFNSQKRDLPTGRLVMHNRQGTHFCLFGGKEPKVALPPVSYLFLRKYSKERCSFKHDGKVDESKIDGAIDKMRPGVAKFVELD